MSHKDLEIIDVSEGSEEDKFYNLNIFDESGIYYREIYKEFLGIVIIEKDVSMVSLYHNIEEQEELLNIISPFGHIMDIYRTFDSDKYVKTYRLNRFTTTTDDPFFNGMFNMPSIDFVKTEYPVFAILLEKLLSSTYLFGFDITQ